MRNWILGLMLLTGLGCVPGNSPIRIIQTQALDTDCKTSDMLQIAHGVLDIAGNGAYIVDLAVESEIAPPPMTQTNSMMMTLNTPGAHNFNIETLALTYKSTDPSITFDPENIGVFGVVKPASKFDLIGSVIGPKAVQKLKDNVNDPMADPKTVLNVNITVKGRLESGEAISSNTITLPITVKTSTTDPTLCKAWAPAGPCMAAPGQDGAPVMCL
jgi:hypothetical protein